VAIIDQHREDEPRSAPSTFGTRKILLCRDGLTVSTVRLNAGLQFASHAHDHDQLCVVLEGQYQESSEGNSVALRAGSVLWRRAGELHANAIGTDDVEVILADIEPERSGRFCLDSAGQAAYFVPGTFEDLHRGLRSEVHRSDRTSSVAIEGLVYLLAARTARHCTLTKPRMPDWLSNAARLIHSDYSHSIRLSQVAAAAGVHPVTLAVAFRRQFGKSVGRYVTDLRITHAKQELENTQRPIAEIALEAGFYDESHMGRVFRARFGISPGAIRRQSIQRS